jgi:hypothetical protein
MRFWDASLQHFYLGMSTTQVESDVGVGGLSKVGLFCVPEESEVCCGVVGKADGEGRGAPQFCTKSRTACRYNTHRDNKANVSCYTYYIHCPRANTARLHPSLSMVCMEVPDEDDDPELGSRLQPMDVWVTYINAINEHEAMNEAGAATARKTRAVTGMEEEDERENDDSPISSTWTRVFAPPLASFT